MSEVFVKLWASQPRRKLPFRYGYPDIDKHVHLMITQPAEPKTMKLALAIVAALLTSLGIARADDPMPSEAPPTTSRPRPRRFQAPSSAERRAGRADARPRRRHRPAPAPAPTEQPAPARARLSVPQPRTIRPRIKDDGESRLEKKEDTVAGGKHFRIKTAQGAVHVWFPPGYDRATAGTVVYVHGYWTDADGAWRDHELARQFRASRQNAMFVVPDAPPNNDESVQWPALTDLRRAVSRANIRHPRWPGDRDGPLRRVPHGDAVGRPPRRRADHPARCAVRRRVRVRRVHQERQARRRAQADRGRVRARRRSPERSRRSTSSRSRARRCRTPCGGFTQAASAARSCSTSARSTSTCRS